jgi:hypothetical protein
MVHPEEEMKPLPESWESAPTRTWTRAESPNARVGVHEEILEPLPHSSSPCHRHGRDGSVPLCQ